MQDVYSGTDSDDVSSEEATSAYNALGFGDSAYGEDTEALGALAGDVAVGGAYGVDEEWEAEGEGVLGGSAYGEDDAALGGYGGGGGGGYGYGDAYDDSDDMSADSSDSLEDEKDLDDLFDPVHKRIRNASADWNVAYQNILTLQPSLDKWNRLGKLARDFNYAASIYGSIIVSEVPLPVERKTIKPVSVGGVAGGDKYIASGMLFKFALDAEGIYGSHEAAMKVAGHELRGLISIFNAGVACIKTPLMALVDFKGFRLIAIALLPIGKDSIIYGSADAAKTVHNSVDKCDNAMKQIGERLNLAEHTVGDKRLCGPGDVEVHRSKANVKDFYAIDTSRLWPPEAPLKESWKPKGWFLYRLLRPELVMPFEEPLSSDAFSRFQLADPNRKALNKAVERATIKLNYEQIPKLATHLEDNCSSLSGKERDFFNLAIQFHRFGVNMRKLGLVRMRVKDKDLRKLLLTEMVTRVAKNILRDRWREKMTRLAVAREEPFLEIGVSMLNLLVGEGKDSKHFWRIVRQQVISKFDGGLTEKETKANLQNLGRVLLSRVIRQLAINTGLYLRPEVEESICDSLDTQQDGEGAIPDILFVDSDLKPLVPRIKQMAIASSAEARAVKMIADAESDKEAKKRLLLLSHFKYKDAVTTVTTASELLVEWAGVLGQMEELDVDNPNGWTSWSSMADDNLELAAKSEPKNPNLWRQWGEICWNGVLQEAKRDYERIHSRYDLEVSDLRKASDVAEKWGRGLMLDESLCDKEMESIVKPLTSDDPDDFTQYNSTALHCLLAAACDD